MGMADYLWFENGLSSHTEYISRHGKVRLWYKPKRGSDEIFVLHREDGPARRIFNHEGKILDEKWFLNGVEQQKVNTKVLSEQN